MSLRSSVPPIFDRIEASAQLSHRKPGRRWISRPDDPCGARWRRYSQHIGERESVQRKGGKRESAQHRTGKRETSSARAAVSASSLSVRSGWHVKASLAKVANAQASVVEAKGANVHAKAEDAKASKALAANVKASVERGEGTIFVARRNVPLLRHFAPGASPAHR